MSQIFLVRHGETFAKTNANELGKPFVCGSGAEISRSTHLTENGKKQMFEVGKKYKDIIFDVVIVSDLIRSRESAVEFLKGSEQESLIPDLVVDVNFTEINYGDDDGVAEEIVKEKKRVFFTPDENGVVKSGEDYAKHCKAESFSDAQKRMQQAIEKIKEKHLNKNILIISHSGAMRAYNLDSIQVGKDLTFGEVVTIPNVQTENKRLVYILPEASEKTHMKYNVEFVTSLAKERGVDIFLILERGNDNLDEIKARTGVRHIYYTGTGILRIVKLKWYLLQVFVLGYRKVYIHYSFIGAILASLNPFFTTYYWNCGIPWQYKRPLLQEAYESLSYKLISHFVTGADILTEKYANFYKLNNKKSIVLPNWIDVKKTLEIKNAVSQEFLRNELGLSPDKKILFFNQRLAERKGAHYILPILKATSDDVVIIITNDGPYKEKLIKEIKENNLEHRAKILGRVPNEKVIQIMSITHVYILPSEEEGMSHSLMEAMCASVPAVSFNVGGTFDMYPQGWTEYCVIEKDISMFCKLTNKLLNDSTEAASLGKALFEKVKEYNKNIILDKFVKNVIN